MKLNEIGVGEPPVLKDQFLVVETESDGYTNTVAGHYNYEVVSEGEDYKIYPTNFDPVENKFVHTDEMVVYSVGDTVYYVANTTSDPYNSASIETLMVEDGMIKENRVLQAFMLYAKDQFTFGVYNVFLTGDLNLAESPNVIHVTGITLDKTSIDLLVGATGTLVATVSPENADNKAFAFSVTDSGVATVTKEGVVTAVKAGTDTVTATTADGAFTAPCTVTVTEPEPEPEPEPEVPEEP